MTVAERISLCRKEKGCTVEEVAKACNISIASVRAYESGQRVPRDEIKKVLAAYYNRSISDLFF